IESERFHAYNRLLTRAARKDAVRAGVQGARAFTSSGAAGTSGLSEGSGVYEQRRRGDEGFERGERRGGRYEQRHGGTSGYERGERRGGPLRAAARWYE